MGYLSSSNDAFNKEIWFISKVFIAVGTLLVMLDYSGNLSFFSIFV